MCVCVFMCVCAWVCLCLSLCPSHSQTVSNPLSVSMSKSFVLLFLLCFLHLLKSKYFQHELAFLCNSTRFCEYLTYTSLPAAPLWGKILCTHTTNYPWISTGCGINCFHNCIFNILCTIGSAPMKRDLYTHTNDCSSIITYITHLAMHDSGYAVAVWCSVMQCVAVCCSVLQYFVVCCSVLQCVAVCCSVLQCVAVCCSIL